MPASATRCDKRILLAEQVKNAQKHAVHSAQALSKGRAGHTSRSPVELRRRPLGRAALSPSCSGRGPWSGAPCARSAGSRSPSLGGSCMRGRAPRLRQGLGSGRVDGPGARAPPEVEVLGAAGCRVPPRPLRQPWPQPRYGPCPFLALVRLAGPCERDSISEAQSAACTAGPACGQEHYHGSMLAV